MANGKALQKFKDELNEKGCYYGKFNRQYIEQTKTDINRMGGKVDWILKILIGNFILVIVVALIIKFLG